MRPILLAEQKKSVVENTQNGPLPVLRGEKHTKPLPNLNKIKPNKSSLLKETILETNALRQSSRVGCYKAGRGYFVLDST